MKCTIINYLAWNAIANGWGIKKYIQNNRENEGCDLKKDWFRPFQKSRGD